MKPPLQRTLLLTQFHRPFAATWPQVLPELTKKLVAAILAAGQGSVPGRPEYQVTVQFPAAGACYFSLQHEGQRVLVGAAGRSPAGSGVVWETLGHLLTPGGTPAWRLAPPNNPWLGLLMLVGPDELPLSEARELRGFAVQLALGFLSEVEAGTSAA